MTQNKLEEKQASLKLSWPKAELERVRVIMDRYPEDRKRSAVIPVLKLAQDTFGGWVSVDAMNLVAETLDMPYIRVYEIATFYTMFNLKPVGKYHIQVCTNCGCMIRGGEKILQAAVSETGCDRNHISDEGLFTVSEVECLGACVDAPVMQVNNHYYTNLTPEKAREIVNQLKNGEEPEPDTVADPLKTRY